MPQIMYSPKLDLGCTLSGKIVRLIAVLDSRG
jgi:hypothetical protein